MHTSTTDAEAAAEAEHHPEPRFRPGPERNAPRLAFWSAAATVIEAIGAVPGGLSL